MRRWLSGAKLATLHPFKSLLLAAALAILGTVAVHADDPLQTQVIGPFGLLNSVDDPAIIAASQAQTLLNVDVTPGGRSVKKREGYSLDATFTTSSGPVHGAYKFFDANGNEVRLFGQDDGLRASVAGAAYVRVSTGTDGATWQCTDYLGFAYCVTSAHDTPIKTNGTLAGTTFQPTIPAGTMIASTPDRILVAGTSSNPARLYYSGSTALTDFTLGTLATSSSYDDITAPGSGLTHITYRYGKWLWWKDQSFGYLIGTGQFDLQLITVSNTIGTLDNTDVYDSGLTYFRGSDNHFYTFDGANLQRISRDITPTVNSANRRKASTWIQTSQSDFGSGYFVGTSSVASPGDVTLGRFSDTFSTLSNWTQTGASIFVAGSGYVAQTTTPTVSSTADMYSVAIPSNINNWRLGAQLQYANTSLSGGTVCSVFVSTGPGASKGYGFSLNATFNKTTLAILGPDISNTSGTNDFPFDATLHRVDLSRSATGYLQIYFDGVSTGTVTDNTYTTFGNARITCTSPKPSLNVLKVSNLSFSASTGTYYSAVENAPNLVQWNTFSTTQQDNDGSQSFFVRSSTNSFTLASSTPAWIAQTPGVVVSASTGTYFQLRDDFSITAATQTPALNDFTFNWLEGSASDKMYGTYFNYAIWFAVSIGTATVNNRILRYDLLNQGWNMYDIASNGFLVYNNSLYFGDPAAGKSYKFGGSTSDNGAAINSYWKSKDFFGTTPFTDEDIKTMSWYCKQSLGTTLSVTSTVNEKAASTYSIPLTDSKANIIKSNYNMPTGTLGNVLNVQIGDNSINPAWECFAGQYQFTPKPWNSYTPQ